MLAVPGKTATVLHENISLGCPQSRTGGQGGKQKRGVGGTGERGERGGGGGAAEDSHWRRHIPHLPQVSSVKGILAQGTQQGDGNLHQKHTAHQHIHVLLQLCHLQSHDQQLHRLLFCCHVHCLLACTCNALLLKHCISVSTSSALQMKQMFRPCYTLVTHYALLLHTSRCWDHALLLHTTGRFWEFECTKIVQACCTLKPMQLRSCEQILTFLGARTLFRKILVSRPAKMTKPMTQSVLRRVQPLRRRLATSKASRVPSALTTAPSNTYSLHVLGTWS